MTTPNQSLPQTVETLLGFGAFEIGGGTYKYGQNLTEDIATTLIRGGSNLLIGAFTSVEGFLVALGAYLNTLPLEALQWMRQFIPGSVLADFDTISSAVATILGALHLDNLVMRAADFIAWIEATYDILETEVHQVLDAFTGAVITPITSRVADFLTWLNNLTGFRTIVDAAVATFTSNFAALISGVGGTVIGDVSSAIAAGVTALARIVSLIAGVGGTTIADVITAVNNGVTALSQLAALLSGTGQASISALAAFINQITQILQNLGNVFPKTFPWIPGVSTNLTSLAPQVLASDFQQLIDGIAGQANATVAHAVGALQQNTAAVQANVNQAVVDGVHAIETNAQGAAQALQSMFGGLLALGTGAPASSANTIQIQAAAQAAYQQLVAHTQTIAAINGELNTSGGGLNVTIPITPGTLPSSFTDLGSSFTVDIPVGVNVGGFAQFSFTTGSVDIAKYNGGVATSDSMSVTSVSTDGTLTVNIIRADSSFSNFVFLSTLQYNGGDGSYIAYVIGCVVSGSPTRFLADGFIATKPNNFIEFLCDTGYNFEFELNGSPQAPVTDSSHVSQLGSSFRNLGFGVASGTPLPGSVTNISVAAQAATVGSGFRQYRTSTFSASFVSAGTAGVLTLLQPPASWFDTNDRITSDITYDSPSNTVTVSRAGWYSVTVCMSISTTSATVLVPGFFHNGAWANQIGQTSSWGNGTAASIQATFSVYCAAGDTLGPGVGYFSGSFVANALGDSTGQFNYFSVTLSN